MASLSHALALLLATCAPCVLAHPWGQFARSGSHSSRGVAVGPAASAPFVLWHTSPTTDDPQPGLSDIFSTAAVSDAGSVFFANYHGCAFSHDAATGAKRWSMCLPDTSSVILGSPALSSDGSRVFFSTDTNSSIFALDTSTGAIVWLFEASLESSFSGSPALADDGGIFAGAHDGYIYALSPAGALRWSKFIGGPDGIVSTPALGTPGTAVYVASQGGTLTALNTLAGQVLWTSTEWAAGGSMHFGVSSSPTVSDDGTLLFIGTWEGELLCFAAATGSVVWRFNASAVLGIPVPYIVATPALSVPGVGRALVYSGTAYMDDPTADAYGTLFALDAGSGAVVWQTPIATNLITAPVVGASGVLYVGGLAGDFIPSGGLVAFDGASGVLVWTKPLGDSFFASPSMGADGTLFIGGTSGEFFALAPYTPPSPIPSPLPPAAASGLSSAATIGLAVLGGTLIAAAAFGLWWGAEAWFHTRRTKDTLKAGYDGAYAALEAP